MKRHLTIFFAVFSIILTQCSEKNYYQSTSREGEKLLFSRCDINFFTRKKNGICVYYYLNGDTLSLSNFKNDKLNGLTKTFFSDGTVESLSFLREDQLHGKTEKYYQNGQLAFEIEYKWNTLFNINNLFDYEGNMLDPGGFVEGNGIVYKYDSLGDLTCFGRMKNGKRTGYWKDISNTGHIDSLLFLNGQNSELGIEYILSKYMTILAIPI